ncbi:MFS transporter [Sulfurisphaera ohwakuensis]|uniref:MFS family permease n=1 Tax=Sulfurisphaera ohwakuensis TaxID=69656 RepID=A0A650CFI7_SULOH|nr:MFS transporter [Sulfurisphaera ohwakuensis]MBB5254986.1 MFS family permease [Sulfurisphaera ohwakuensis]QGR16623.1 MFS transporter [Sulfurisphaera ohwakuensis]
MEKSIHELVDKAKWTSIHSLMFASLAIGFFMWGVISSIAPIIYPSINNVFFLLTPTFVTIAGNLLLPFFSDKRLGRKTTFFITMTLYSLGTLLIALAALLSGLNVNNLAKFPYIAFLVAGIVLGVLGVEGEVPVMLSYTAEMMPLDKRDIMLVLAPNFDNIGAMVAALIGYITYSASNSFSIQLLALSVVAFIGVITAIIIRLLLPESIRWLVVKGNLSRAEKEVEKIVRKTKDLKEQEVNKKLSLGARYAFLAIIGISQYLTYGLMAFVVADFYFSGATTSFIIFIANLGASIAGLIAGALITKIKSRVFALFSYVGGALSMIPIILLTSNFNLIGFYILLFVNMLFSEFAWATRTIYEPTLMPNNLRAFMIGLIRLAPITAYAISVYVLGSYLQGLSTYIWYNTALWVIGAIATVLWFFKGLDTNNVSLEKID